MNSRRPRVRRTVRAGDQRVEEPETMSTDQPLLRLLLESRSSARSALTGSRYGDRLTTLEAVRWTDLSCFMFLGLFATPMLFMGMSMLFHISFLVLAFLAMQRLLAFLTLLHIVKLQPPMGLSPRRPAGRR